MKKISKQYPKNGNIVHVYYKEEDNVYKLLCEYIDNKFILKHTENKYNNYINYNIIALDEKNILKWEKVNEQN